MSDPSDYTQVSVAGTDYFLRNAANCGPVVGYRHDVARDVWRSLRPGPRPRHCGNLAAFAHGADIHVLNVADVPGGGISMSIHHTASGSWEALDTVSLDPCVVMGLATGILCTRRGEESLPLRYSWFDYQASRWRDGSVDLGVANTGERVQPVTVGGRALALSTVWPPDFSVGGTMTLVTFDPSTGQRLSSTSREMSVDALQAAEGGNLQAAGPGYVYLGPRSFTSSTKEADLVDLRTGQWSTLQMPVQGATQRSDADWVADYYGDDAAGYVVANDYLYDPGARRWLAVPTTGIAPPDRDSESDSLMTRAGPRQQCTWTGTRECWALDIGSLEGVSTELEASELPVPR